jgi:hypothetical protein
MTCVSTTFDQVMSVLTVAANIVSLGMTTSVNAATGSVRTSIRLGSKVFTTAVPTSRAAKFINVLKDVQTYHNVGTTGMIQPTTVIKRFIGNVDPTSVATTAYEKYNDLINLQLAVAGDFVAMTNQDISDMIDANYNPVEANFIKQYYAKTMLSEVQATVEYGLAKDALSAVAMIDPTGLADLVNNFTHPSCAGLNLSFPTKPTIIYRNGAPNAGVGAEGNYYVNTDSNNGAGVNNLYGPKTNGVWPQWVPKY